MSASITAVPRHFALTTAAASLARWQQAFPHGRICRPQELAVIGDGDCVWLVTADDWLATMAELARRGAIVVAMAGNPSSEQTFQALAAGARGYVHLLSPATLLHQVETVVTNQGLWVGSDLLAQVAGTAFGALGGDATAIREDKLQALTTREREVALAVANGRTNKEAARELDITERTVKAHLSAVFRKLEVRDRLQLVRLLADSSPA